MINMSQIYSKLGMPNNFNQQDPIAYNKVMGDDSSNPTSQPVNTAPSTPKPPLSISEVLQNNTSNSLKSNDVNQQQQENMPQPSYKKGGNIKKQFKKR